jgi:hypothetical protein
MKKNIILLYSLIFTCLPVAAMEVEGVNIPDTFTFNNSDTTLVLNGAGLREKFFLDIYIGALYLPAKTPDARAILGDTGPASVLMHILHGEISKEKITGGWNEGLEKNISQKKLAAIEPQLKKFNSLFKTVRKGDSMRIDYRPETGTEVRINGEWRGAVEGNEFFRALLSIWLGEDPVGKSLKHEMLGNK